MNGPNEFLKIRSGRQFVHLLEREIHRYEERDAYGLVGVFGTKEIGHDIDVLFYPSGDRKKGAFVNAHIELLRRVKERLRKDYSSDLVPFPMLELQDEVEYISGRTSNQVFLHNLVFADYQGAVERVPFLDNLVNSNMFEAIHGSTEALNQSHTSPLDFYYFTLINSLILLSNYPLELLSKKVAHLRRWTLQYAAGINEKKPSKIMSLEEATQQFQETLEILDTLEA